MILGFLGLLMFVEYTGMENGLDALVNQPLHLTVGKLCRITGRFRRDGFHAQLVDFPAGKGRQHHPEAQFLKECGPEGVIFIHIQHSGNADGAPGGIRFFQRRVVKHHLLLKLHQIGSLVGLGTAAAGAFFAAVAADVLLAAGEFVDGEHAVVAAAAAADAGGGVGQLLDFIQGQHGTFLTGVVIFRRQCCAEGTHQTGNIRAGDLHSGDILESPQHRLVVEGAALDHDVLPQVLGGGQLDDLVQGVFDYGVG